MRSDDSFDGLTPREAADINDACEQENRRSHQLYDDTGDGSTWPVVAFAVVVIVSALALAAWSFWDAFRAAH